MDDAERARGELASRIASAVRLGGGRTRVAAAADIPVGSLDRYTSGKSEPPALTLAAIANACNVSLDWLALRASSPDLVALVPSGSSDLQGYVTVPRLDVRASAGPGQAVVPADEQPPSFIAFREQWLRSLGVNPRNAEFLEAHGDSMYPTIQDGDLLLLDRGIDRVESNGIYVLVAQGLVLVKRLQLLIGGSLLIISDNAKYEREVVTPDAVADLRVEGRVRWYGRAI